MTTKKQEAQTAKELRELIANLLIGLQSQTLTAQQRRQRWKCFEVLLRQYYDLKIYRR